MARIDDLPADQRAALQLLLKQGRTYDEIAQMLRIDVAAVRERARAALDALGPEDVEGLELAEQDEIADYLLGQQSASQRAATRKLLEGSPAGRAWARTVAGELRPLAGDDLPEIPAEAAEVDEAFDALQARSRHRDKVERSSKVGGAILLAGVALVVVLVVLLLTGALSGDDEDGGSASTTATTSTTDTPPVEAQINLTPPRGRQSRARGVAVVSRQNDTRVVAMIAEGLQAANENRFYAVWLYTSPTKAKRLGFPNPQPAEDGRVETGFALPSDANEYRSLILTRESRREPRRPGTIELQGELPRDTGGRGGGGGGGGGGGTSTGTSTNGG
jgi:hypothetical protein